MALLQRQPIRRRNKARSVATITELSHWLGEADTGCHGNQEGKLYYRGDRSGVRWAIRAAGGHLLSVLDSLICMTTLIYILLFISNYSGVRITQV